MHQCERPHTRHQRSIPEPRHQWMRQGRTHQNPPASSHWDVVGREGGREGRFFYIDASLSCGASRPRSSHFMRMVFRIWNRCAAEHRSRMSVRGRGSGKGGGDKRVRVCLCLFLSLHWPLPPFFLSRSRTVSFSFTRLPSQPSGTKSPIYVPTSIDQGQSTVCVEASPRVVVSQE
jgi:hypothetical protein